MKPLTQKVVMIVALGLMSACSNSRATDSSKTSTTTTETTTTDTTKSRTPSSDHYGNNTSMGTTTGNDSVTDGTLQNRKNEQNNDRIHRRPSSTTGKPSAY